MRQENKKFRGLSLHDNYSDDSDTNTLIKQMGKEKLKQW
jgi:hypothetical protein